MSRLAIFSFLLLDLFLSSYLLSALNYEEAKIVAEKINKPALLTILSPDGDLIDCVDETKQPAFDHPLLKNHILQRIPEKERDDECSKRYVKRVTQVWQKNGTRCPIGSVPIRRVKVEELMRVSSISEFGKKPKHFGRNLVPETTSPESEKVIAVFNRRTRVVHGASATVSVWNLTVENPGEHSLSQIWIFSGDEDGFNTVEAGWRVQHGSIVPTLFTYWTADGYRHTGCYNTICPSGSGFLQNNRGVALGAALAASTMGGEQKEINLQIHKDQYGNWRLNYDTEEVGYWPKELFNAFGARSTIVEWGGEVRNRKINGKHTATGMGSGQYAHKKHKKASYFKDLHVQASNYRFTRVLSDDIVMDVPDQGTCYNEREDSDENGFKFYYGGPGFHRIYCP